MGRHYIGDVVVGLLLGMITTAVVTQVIRIRHAIFNAMPYSMTKL